MGELCSGMLHNEGPGAAVRPLGQQLSCQEGFASPSAAWGALPQLLLLPVWEGK